METVNLCECGCGEPAVYAARHWSRRWRKRITPDDYRVEDRGYKTPCWVAFRHIGGGYGKFRIGGKQVLAHRAMYEQEVGPIPDGLVIDHLCRVTICMNPAHLEAVTPAVNTQRGLTAKLTPELVRLIRAVPSSETAAFDLAEEFGVTSSLIYQVWQRKVWRDLE